MSEIIKRTAGTSEKGLAAIKIPKEIIKNRKLVMSLSKNDFKQKFAGSYLGIVWAFVQPVMTILVYWFVFTVGFRSMPMGDVPFVIFLASGIIPWFFFSDALNGGTTSLLDYSYLVKKVVFNIDILPMIRMVSALFVHLFFVAFGIFFAWAYGYTPSLYTVQLLYYIVCCFLLALGASYLNSAIVVFFQDLKQVVSVIILQIGTWLTPIMWDAPQMLASHPRIHLLMKLNPMYYVVDGFRDSLVYHRWFFDKGWWTLYFWAFVLILFLLGTRVFRKLKVHFADVL